MLIKDYDLTIITNTSGPEFLAELGPMVRVIPLDIPRNVSIWRDLKALIALMVVFRREKFDLVHSLSPKSGLLGMVAAWVTGIPLRVHTFQGEVWVTRKGLWRSLLKFLDKCMARCANRLLVVSHSEEQFLVEQKIIPAGALKMLAHGSICGVDIERFKTDAVASSAMRRQIGIPQQDKIILYVGRLNKDKGLLDLADAFARIASEYPHVHLLVVGPDEENMREKMLRRCPDSNMRLHFSDYTPNPEHYMAAADLLCLPSYREGFGLVLIEAAATGIPTIGSRIYGISDAIVDGETGLLFSPGDVDELVQKIVQLIDHPDLATSIGKAGQVRARRDFSRELALSEFRKYYKEIFKLRFGEK